MSKKAEQKKTPFWMSLIRFGITAVFIAYVIVPPHLYFYDFAVWGLTFWVGVFGFLLGCSFGVAAIVSRRKAKKERKAAAALAASASAVSTSA